MIVSGVLHTYDKCSHEGLRILFAKRLLSSEGFEYHKRSTASQTHAHALETGVHKRLGFQHDIICENAGLCPAKEQRETLRFIDPD